MLGQDTPLENVAPSETTLQSQLAATRPTQVCHFSETVLQHIVS